jgi:cellulose synthase/poly-beta-1,6-N-acetylglucosamine synthase-like glycosyltransferase
VTILSWLLLAAGVPLVLLSLILFVEVVAAALPRADELPASTGRRPGLAVLVPAHNEALVISGTLTALRSQLCAGDRLLVVADNCTDDTAKLAESAGAEVLHRHDTEHPGKGYALDYGLQYLGCEPPEVVVIIDADCTAGPGAIERIARRSAKTGRPVQALYLMSSPRRATIGGRIAEFAWQVKNQVRPLGARRLGMPCQFMGSGMAIPWRLLSSVDMATGNIVEDLKLGIDLALRGSPVLFEPGALVCSEFPGSEAALKSQRTRWEHGHLHTIVKAVPAVLAKSLYTMDLQLCWLAMDLLVPPLSLLLCLVGLFLLVTIPVTLLGAGALPLCLGLCSLSLLLAAILCAWALWGRQLLALSDLFFLPAYVLAKLPIYGRYLVRRQREWVKTDRD